MGIFHRRYFCVFSFAFLLASFVASKLTLGVKLWGMIALLFLSVAALVLVFVNKKLRFAFLAVLMALVFMLVGFFNSFVFISLPQAKAQSKIGTDAVEMKIISTEYSTENGAEYLVKIKQIGEERTNIKAYFSLDFASELSYGDRVITLAEIEALGNANQDSGVFLRLAPADGAEIYHKSADTNAYFSLDGIVALFKNVRSGFIEYINSLFGDKDGAFLRGMLINDTSDIPSKTMSDFRRSGVSHILSVSGFHIALLLGGCDFLLRKLYVSKKIRCVAVVCFGFAFLALTDFAPSAVRSALMLFSLYLSFIISEDSDAITSLFASVFLIVFLSPFSIFDLGLFMSFAATLGLLTLYPYIEEKLPKIKTKRKLIRLLGKGALSIVKTVLITLVANFFLLPILWYFFGEISLAAIPANLAVSPLSAVYLALSIVALIFGKIPLLGSVLVNTVRFVGYTIGAVAETLARWNGAVVSLNIPFANILVIAFSIAMAVMLVIKLKHKIIACIPALAFAVAFSVCFAVFSISAQNELRYVEYKDNEFIMLERAQRLSVCDVGNASYDSYYLLIDSLPPYATEIDKYIVTHAHKNHAYTIERVLRTGFIRELYLPLTNDRDELVNVEKIYNIASEYNTQIVFYQSGEHIDVLDGVSLRSYFEANALSHSSVYITVDSVEGERIFTYTDASESDAAIEYGAQSRYFLLGAHGIRKAPNYKETTPSVNTTVILPYSERRESSVASFWEENVYVIGDKKNKKTINLPLC